MAGTMRVAVIGAGAAGLAAARQLSVEGLDPVIFEGTSRLGGTWVYTDAVESDPLGRDPARCRIHTSMYADLRTNLPRDLMAFREYPFDGRGGGTDDGLRFPPHIDVLHYLERYARSFDLVRLIRFEHTVTAVIPLDANDDPWHDRRDEPERWLLHSSGPDGKEQTATFDAVAICNGHYAFPHVPDLPGAGVFAGTQMHSHSYRRPEAYRGQRVALLGARASGIDIALEIGKHAREVHLCARGVERAQPFFGRENVALSPPIDALEAPSGIVLRDGSRIDDVDALLYCTGYEYRLPFLDPAGLASPIVEVHDNWIHPLLLDVVAARARTLGLIGLANRIVPFPQYELQAMLFARGLVGSALLPEREERERSAQARADELRKAGIAQRHFLQQGDAQFAYNDDLAKLCGVELLPPSFQTVYRAVEQARFRDPEAYREEEFPWVDPESERRFTSRRASPGVS